MQRSLGVSDGSIPTEGTVHLCSNFMWYILKVILVVIVIPVCLGKLICHLDENSSWKG